MKDLKTTLSGIAGLGFVIASFLVKNPQTSQTLLGVGVAFGAGGLTMAKDSTPIAPTVPAPVTGHVGTPPADMAGK